MKTLGSIGCGNEDAVAVLAEGLSADDPDLRYTALVALGQHGRAASSAARSVAALLGDPHRRLSQAAAVALGKISPADPEVTIALRSAIQSGRIPLEGDLVAAVSLIEATANSDLAYLERQSRVRARAHELWEAEGRPEGADIEHWERASREVP